MDGIGTPPAVWQNCEVQPRRSELRVIAAAEALARTLGNDPNHTVAAAALDIHGRLHSAVNVHHFTGGPCAELVALGVAAASHAGPLVAMAAAGNRGRGLIPPCGRCRQTMLDLHPDLLVAVPTDMGPQMRPIVNLLPDTYFFPDADAQRVWRFNKRYYDDIARGTKTSSVRWNESVPTGRVILYFEDDDRSPLLGEVLGVNNYSLSELTAERLRLGEGGSVDEYIRGLQQHYPEMPRGARVDVVYFTLR